MPIERKCHFCVICKEIISAEDKDTHTSTNTHKENKKDVESLTSKLATDGFITDIQGALKKNLFKCQCCESTLSDYNAALHHFKFHYNNTKIQVNEKLFMKHVVVVEQYVEVSQRDIDKLENDSNVIFMNTKSSGSQEFTGDSSSSLSSSDDEPNYEKHSLTSACCVLLKRDGNTPQSSVNLKYINEKPDPPATINSNISNSFSNKSLPCSPEVETYNFDSVSMSDNSYHTGISHF